MFDGGTLTGHKGLKSATYPQVPSQLTEVVQRAGAYIAPDLSGPQTPGGVRDFFFESVPPVPHKIKSA